jgi:hypothetical protein
MTRLLEILVAIVIVCVLAVVFAIFLPAHRHIERSVEVSSPARQIFDVVDGFHTFPSWNALHAYDRGVQLNFEGPGQGPGAKVTWTSNDKRIGNGSYTVSSMPAPQQDSQVTWDVSNPWRGENKHFTIDIVPAPNGKTSRITMGYDVDFGWDLYGRYTGMYLDGNQATQIQYQLGALQTMLATFPNIDYTPQQIDLKDVEKRPIIFISTTAKRTLDDVADATDKAMQALQAQVKKSKINVTGARITITTNLGDENYDFDMALPVDKDDYQVQDPVKMGSIGGSKELVTSFTGSAAQLPALRLTLKAYAYTHGYVFDESSEGPGRFYEETTSDPNAPDDQQTFVVHLPLQQAQ